LSEINDDTLEKCEEIRKNNNITC